MSSFTIGNSKCQTFDWREPQNTSLNNTGFTDGQRKILDEVGKRISRKDCKDWVNKKLASLGAPKNLNTLDKLLSAAAFRLYDENLSNTQLGVSIDEMIGLWDSFHNYDDKLARTIGKQVFMIPLAFKRNTIWIPGTDNRDIDTATIAVHELFHVAGFKDPVIQSLNREIHEHCGFLGMNY